MIFLLRLLEQQMANWPPYNANEYSPYHQQLFKQTSTVDSLQNFWKIVRTSVLAISKSTEAKPSNKAQLTTKIVNDEFVTIFPRDHTRFDPLSIFFFFFRWCYFNKYH